MLNFIGLIFRNLTFQMANKSKINSFCHHRQANRNIAMSAFGMMHLFCTYKVEHLFKNIYF